MMMMKGQEHLSYEEKMRDLGAFKLEEKAQRILSICINT